DSLDPPDFTDFSDIATPGLRGALATAVLWVPAALYLHFSYGSVQDTVDAAAEASLAGDTVEREAAPDVGTLMEGELAKTRALEKARELSRSETIRIEGLGEEAEGLEWERVGGSGDRLDQTAERLAAGAARAEGADAAEEGYEEEGGEPYAEEARAERPYAPPAPPRSPWKDPVLYLLAVLGLLWMPVAILSAAAGGTALQMLNPLRPVIFALRIPREYAVAVGAFALVSLGGTLLALVGNLIELLPIPLLPGWAAASLGVYPPLVAGRALGLLLVVRGAELGYLREEETWEEALPGAEPQGRLPVAFGGAAAAPSSGEGEEAPAEEQSAPAPRRRHAPIELEDEPVVAPPAPRPAPAVRGMGTQGLERAAPAAAPSDAVSAGERLRAAVQAQSLAQALLLYPAALREPGAALPADCHFAVGRHAAAQGQYPLAVHALRAACAAQPAGPLAAQSLVLMARVLGERMGDAAGAQRVYEHVVRHYPDSAGARFARGRLAPPTS
ncbi:MAG TPA: hypothetical protein VFO83_01355, partial [Aggregicoccus sp.]|nr:hypothetical protein [Aggregicoccus sp.]